MKTTAPMQLHRTYGGCSGDITSLDWSEDSEWIAVASKDLSARCETQQLLRKKVAAPCALLTLQAIYSVLGGSNI